MSVETLQRYYKALAGLIGPAVVLLIVALGDGHISQGEWLKIAIAALGTSGLVAAFPANKKKDA